MSEKNIFTKLNKTIGNAYGTSALMGNLRAESGLSSINVQNSGNKKLGLTDQQYTDKVDNGKYTNFVKDAIGYGLAQWTYWTRKKALLTYAKKCNVSIGNENMQIAFLLNELKTNYPTVLTALKNAKNVRDASDIVLHKFENPAVQTEVVEKVRASYGVAIYKKYATASKCTKPLYTIKTIPNATKVDSWVKSLQKVIGVTQDGKYGKDTLSKCPTIKKGMSGSVIKLLQSRLNSLENAGLKVDGEYGNDTKNAVVRYETWLGFNDETGEIQKSYKTWSALLLGYKM